MVKWDCFANDHFHIIFFILGLSLFELKFSVVVYRGKNTTRIIHYPKTTTTTTNLTHLCVTDWRLERGLDPKADSKKFMNYLQGLFIEGSKTQTRTWVSIKNVNRSRSK